MESSSMKPSSISSWLPCSPLGSGSFGHVSLALNLENGSLFAVKSAHASSPTVLLALRNELHILQTLHSPFTIHLLGSNFSPNSDSSLPLHSLFLEYMDGGSLFDALKQSGGNLQQELHVRCFTRSILQGLSYLHQSGIVHCDIKCQNILVGSSGVKIGDFGTARRLEEASISGGNLRGTPLWMAPEVVQGAEAMPASDIWSLGCTVVEMLQGRPPWGHVGSVEAALFKVGCSKENPPLPESISTEAKDFLSRCLQRDVSARWTAAELLKHPFVSGLDGDGGAFCISNEGLFCTSDERGEDGREGCRREPRGVEGERLDCSEEQRGVEGGKARAAIHGSRGRDQDCASEKRRESELRFSSVSEQERGVQGSGVMRAELLRRYRPEQGRGAAAPVGFEATPQAGSRGGSPCGVQGNAPSRVKRRQPPRGLGQRPKQGQGAAASVVFGATPRAGSRDGSPRTVWGSTPSRIKGRQPPWGLGQRPKQGRGAAAPAGFGVAPQAGSRGNNPCGFGATPQAGSRGGSPRGVWGNASSRVEGRQSPRGLGQPPKQSQGVAAPVGFGATPRAGSRGSNPAGFAAAPQAGSRGGSPRGVFTVEKPLVLSPFKGISLLFKRDQHRYKME
ncbi:hypothetical protein L7F22_066686 [Adiantum nelumboides]|nr:hypothetical protein [Adiantum nelumboides]